MSQRIQGSPFHIEHIIPLARGGPTEESNLALACPSCNLQKGTDIDALDPETAQEARLFHPRRDRWHEHFALAGTLVVGRTPTGRATAILLEMNVPRRRFIREVESLVGLAPPDA